MEPHRDKLGDGWLEAHFLEHPSSIFEPIGTIISFDNGTKPEVIGTAAVISSHGQQAIAISATHNFEHIVKVENPWSVRPVLPIPELRVHPLQKLKLGPEQVRVMFDGPNGPYFAYVAQLLWDQTLDICLMVLEAEAMQSPFGIKVPMLMQMPTVGEVVAVLTYDADKASMDGTDFPYSFQIKRRCCMRLGKVTNVFGSGCPGAPWPVFTTTIPIGPGMSGGICVSEPVQGGNIKILGVLSRDDGSAEARASHLIAGRSYMSAIWPACGYKMLSHADGKDVELTLFDFAKKGVMDIQGLEHVSLSMEADGRTTVRYKGL